MAARIGWPAALRSSPPSSSRLMLLGLLGILCGAIILGMVARLHDLGGAPLADDEYYTTRSIEWILAEGVPAIPGGGYYSRGPLFQYAAAGFAQLLEPGLLAYRLPSALCGLLVSVLGFVYARRFGGVAVGIAVAVALLLSSWAIEFGRLVRFYTLFQAAVLIFLIALDKAYFEARPGWRYAPHLVLVVAALAHELAVLLAPLLFLPLLPNCTRLNLRAARAWIGFALVSLLVTLFVVSIIVGLDLRFRGVIDRYPDGYTGPLHSEGPFALPVLPFFRLFASPLQHLAVFWLGAALLVAAFAAARQAGLRRLDAADLLLVLAALAALFHLVAAVVLVLAVAIARYDLWRLSAQPPRRLALLGATLAVVLAWLALAAADPGRVVDGQVIGRWDITDPTTPGAILRGLWSTFFGWPDFYRPTLRPFATELPALGLALLAALAWFVVTHRHAALPDVLRHPATVTLYWAVAMALFTVGTTTSRYWFPLLPVLYTLIAVSLAEVATRWRPRAAVAARRGASLGFVALFALSSDFQPGHILNVGSDAVRYRSGPFAAFAALWYPRWDVRTPAETVASWHDGGGARIVVDTLPALSYYLDIEHAVFLDRNENRFAIVSREQGRRDMWSGRRLLSTAEELLDHAAGAEELWLLRGTDPSKPGGVDLEALSPAHLSEVSRAPLGADGRIELIRLRPTADRQR